MRLFGKVVLAILACVLLISGIAVLSPRAVYAVVATIIRDQDNPARHPFTTECTSNPDRGGSVSCNTPAIPAGQEVVIETISINGFGDSTNTVVVVEVDTSAGGVLRGYRLNPISDDGALQPNGAEYEGAQSLR